MLTKRSLARIRREPETLADVTIQPVIFILMFAYVFGGGYAFTWVGVCLGMALRSPEAAQQSGLLPRSRSSCSAARPSGNARLDPSAGMRYTSDL